MIFCAVALPLVWPQNGVVMSVQPRPWPDVPELTARMARSSSRQGNLAMRIRDELGEVYADARFAGAFGVRGRPGISPGQLMMASVLQFSENLTDRQAAEAVRDRMTWKYALGLELEDPGFDASVLSEFRSRLVAGDLMCLALDALLERLAGLGLVKAGGRQRTDSTHVLGAMRQATHVTGIRRARYLGLPKTQLEHNIAAAAINMIRMDAYWTGHPLDRTRSSHLARLDFTLTA
jgi:transposase